MEGRFLLYCYSLSFISCFLASAAFDKQSILTDRDALLFLKDQLTLDPKQIITKNWSIGSSTCTWIGVSCGLRHYRVTSLSIVNMGLAGTIVPQLGNLSFLASLDLSGNNFHGELPGEFVNLRRLKVLHLNRNALSGKFPSWVSSLNRLESLHLNNNSFTGSIPSSITNLTNMKSLICFQNELSGSIPFEIFNVSSLEVLSLAFNNIYGSLPNPMCANPHKLYFISLRYNMLNGHLPLDMSQCSKLTYLDVSNNNFSGQIPETFGNMENLERAYFEHNNLIGTISIHINNLISLQTLSLRGNQLTGTIPKEISNLTNLQMLVLDDNHLTGTIPKELGNLMKLELLRMENNEMIGTIPLGIFNITSVVELFLNRNHFTGSLPSSLGFGLLNLENFSVYQNMLSGVIPLFIANSSRLYNLDLASNNFHGTIPHILGNLRFLVYLDLYGNNLTKDSSSLELEFLRPLANCIHLKSLQLSGNPFNGILPKSIGNLSNSVWFLTISNCGMSGEIPPGIGNLSNLLALDLSYNQLSGSVPTTVALLQKLQFLYLRGNKLSGTLCDVFGLQQLYQLFLDNNKFFGPIPDCIRNATSLRKLNLGANKLSSSIPMALWNLNELLELDLSSNFLSGSLSNNVGNMKATTILDLSMNSLAGYIPDAVGSLLNLEVLNLSHNLLEGLIPDSIGGMVSLTYLNISQNNLSGFIPVTLANLQYLKELNVSHNNLVGPIPFEGPFKKFTWESFIFNKGLCGEKRFHVPPCPLASPKKLWTHKHLLILCFAVIAIVSVIALAVVYLQFRRKNLFQRNEDLVQVTTMDRISFYELQKATDGYDERNLIGKGSFGSVYKGTLRDGLVVAVKVFDMKIEGVLKSFDVECEMLRNLRHRNLTQVISSCSNLQFKAIILEFMPNGSLENWLHSENHFLSFQERLNIIIDVAYALQYLHSGYPTPVVHADLKPSNVLLDEDMVAHVCDFGIAKMLEENSTTFTNTLGTFGYIAPEYGSQGLVSTKCDVYSYGILLMEVFTRKRPNDEMFNESLTLHSWVNNSLCNAMIDIIDDNLLNKFEVINLDEIVDYVLIIMNIALNCTKELPKERSGMEEIISTLRKIKRKL